MAENSKSSKKTVTILVIIIVLLLLLGAGGVTWFLLSKEPGGTGISEPQLTENGEIPYAIDVGVVTPNELVELIQQDANHEIPLHFSTHAVSSDGENFKCVLGNPPGARYDMYYDMYADSNFTERIYTSGLIAPGTQIENFKSNKKFPKGETDVFAVVTTVDDDHKTLIAQNSIVITFIVAAD